MEIHVGGFDIFLVEVRDFVVEELVFWDDALALHMIECASTGQNHFPLHFFYWLHPSGVSVDVVEDHLILVAAAGFLRQLASLVCEDRGFRLVDRYKDGVLL